MNLLFSFDTRDVGDSLFRLVADPPLVPFPFTVEFVDVVVVVPLLLLLLLVLLLFPLDKCERDGGGVIKLDVCNGDEFV